MRSTATMTVHHGGASGSAVRCRREWRLAGPPREPPTNALGSAPQRPGDGSPSLRDSAHLRHLARYIAADTGHERRIVSVERRDGSALLIDSLSDVLADARLIAHLAPDEPSANAQLMCDLYLADETRGRCRRLTAEDLELPALTEPAAEPIARVAAEHTLLDSRGCSYRLGLVASHGPRPELRWTRMPCSQHADRFETVGLRDVVAAVENYEPARTITALKLAAQPGVPRISTRRLHREATRLACSPIVLNRRLREAVERKVADGLSMSEIALRCGQGKRNPHGTRAGSASWLARRIGLSAEAGHAEPTPWVHTDTLALIARDGLGMCPNEVEL